MIGWSFPKNDGGKEDGLNDAGLEHFRDRPLKSLAREINQNSLDASNSDDPVKVHFKRMDLPVSELEGRAEFGAVIDSAAEYWSESPKTKDFLRGIERLVNNPANEKISVLKISDFNTTGLTGSDNTNGGDWLNLTKRHGSPDKPGDTLGSFGIGKGAPFACSLMHTVFYATKDKDQKEAFQGVARLVTHKDEDGDKTQGTGYFGINEGKLPVVNGESIPPFFRRTEVGTDIYIFGFINTKPDYDDWQHRICSAVLENFCVALHNNKLSVEISDEDGTDIKINQDTLPELLENYSREKGFKAHHFYQAVVSEKSHRFSEENFMGMGKIALDILVEKNCPKQIAMLRGTGMNIYFRKVQSHMHFAGVFQATGEKINEALKEMEPPQHNNWESERFSDPKKGKRIKKEILAWIRAKIIEVTSQNAKQEVDFEGMQEFLPDELDEELESSAETPGTGKPESTDKTTEQETDTDPSEKPERKPIISTPNPIPKPVQSGKDGETGPDLDPNPNGPKPPVKDPRPGPRPIPSGPTLTPLDIKRARILSSDSEKGAYTIMYLPGADGHGLIRFKASGEEESLVLEIETAEDESGKSIPVRPGGTVGPLDVKKDVKSVLYIRLKQPLRCALEIK